MHQIKTILMIAALILTSGCAGMVNKVDKDSVAQVRKVAIVGFTYDRQAANSGKTIGDALLGKNDGLMGKLVELEASEQATDAYQKIALRLKEKRGWQVMDRNRVVSAPGVISLYEKKNETIQTGVAPLQPQHYRYESVGIPQTYYVQYSDKGALSQLAKDLGVDALVLVHARTRLSQTSLMGIGVGKIGTVSDISFFLFDPKRSDFSVVMNASSDEVATDQGKVGGFAAEKEMDVYATKATAQALDRIIEAI